MSASSLLAELPPAFTDAGLGSQSVFRSALQALSRPGSPQAVELSEVASTAAWLGVSPALVGLLLTLLDGEVSLWLSPALDTPALRRWLGFHSGVHRTDEPERANFLAMRCDELNTALWQRIPLGTDDRPQDGATLLVEVHSLTEGQRLMLTGPGLPAPKSLAVGGVSPEMWMARSAVAARYPLGAEWFLCQDRRFIGLPRSTRVQVED